MWVIPIPRLERGGAGRGGALLCLGGGVEPYILLWLAIAIEAAATVPVPVPVPPACPVSTSANPEEANAVNSACRADLPVLTQAFFFFLSKKILKFTVVLGLVQVRQNFNFNYCNIFIYI